MYRVSLQTVRKILFSMYEKLLGIEEKEHEKEIVFEQEEKKDG